MNKVTVRKLFEKNFKQKSRVLAEFWDSSYSGTRLQQCYHILTINLGS